MIGALHLTQKSAKIGENRNRVIRRPLTIELRTLHRALTIELPIALPRYMMRETASSARRKRGVAPSLGEAESDRAHSVASWFTSA